MTTVSIDPRLRARRSAVLRAQGRRRLRWLVIALVVVITIVTGWFVVRSSLFAIDSIGWSGLDSVTLTEASSAAGIAEGMSLTEADPAVIAERLEELPWVLDANVTRSWWGTVSIDITERTAVAMVMREQDVWVVVDEMGKVLSEAVVRHDLPRLSGIGAAGVPGSDLASDAIAPLEVVSLLPESIRARVEGVARDARGEMWVSLRTADRILLGSDRDIAMKVVALTTVLESLDFEGRTGWEMDVSVPTLPSVRDLRSEWRPVGDKPQGDTQPVEVEG
ncbi:MAG: FtsQ-type POTRA domain-containing protein [Actinomycetia bacterium]|nr:FtsQ-type POTRA domain-containing protein [Actinomycetes bacterium]MCP4962628.1 FtsQ-type POTRA domain-containing protein [Actinomycetes bacterium]